MFFRYCLCPPVPGIDAPRGSQAGRRLVADLTVLEWRWLLGALVRLTNWPCAIFVKMPTKPPPHRYPAGGPSRQISAREQVASRGRTSTSERDFRRMGDGSLTRCPLARQALPAASSRS